MDIDYQELLSDPVTVGRHVLDFAGLTLSPEIEHGMEEWIEANKREHRAAHKYSLEDFNLSQKAIRSRYQDYIKSFVSKK